MSKEEETDMEWAERMLSEADNDPLERIATALERIADALEKGQHVSIPTMQHWPPTGDPIRETDIDWLYRLAPATDDNPQTL